MARMIPYRVTQASQRANASPSVSLERGSYRMHAPNPRPLPALLQGNTPPARRSIVHEINRNLALLLFLLVVGCLACFASAYYLFTTRWAYPQVHLSNMSNPSYEVNASTFTDRQHGGDMSTRYLAYLPHSGFHNQRIAFENALLLAYALRRTLLVPPIRLGNKPMRYVEFDALMQHHELSSKDGLQHCLQVPPYMSRPLECLTYFESTYLPWTWLINISSVAAQQDLLLRSTMSQQWIHDNLGLEERDAYVLRDDSPYQFRFLDTYSDTSPATDRYTLDIYFRDLVNIPHRLLQLGTLFGTSRLRLKHRRNVDHRRAIRQSMMFANPDLVHASSSIARALGDFYIAIHLRTGDGHFKKKVEKTVNSIWWKILHDVVGFPSSAKCDLESVFYGNMSRDCVLDNPNSGSETSSPSLASLTVAIPALTFKIQCRSPRHREQAYQSLNVPLYVATDLRDPSSNPGLDILRRTFPCIFFLGDFPRETQALKRLGSPYDGVSLYPFLLPFVDAMVAGNASKVIGTEGSTFSKFVSEILWSSSPDRPEGL